MCTQERNAKTILLFMVWCFILLPGLLYAEQWPLRAYTTADGLARDWVNRIVQDSRGFLWFCTKDGLSRFDGSQFTNYTTEDGLPDRNVTDLVETRRGIYWVATRGGLCQFNPNGRQRAGMDTAPGVFACPLGEEGKGQRVQVLLEDHAGTLWYGTQHGLYRLERANEKWTSRFVEVRPSVGSTGSLHVTTLLEDHRGNLWIGTLDGLYRRGLNGQTDSYTIRNGLPANAVHALLENREGLWVGTDLGLCQMISESNEKQPRAIRLYKRNDSVSEHIRSLFQSSDGTFWVGNLGQLSEFRPTARTDVQYFRPYTTVEGLHNVTIETMAEDRDGNLWLGTEGNGVLRLARKGFVTYGAEDGLHYLRVRSIFENQHGDLCVLSGPVSIHYFDGRRFTSVPLPVPGPIMGWNQSAFQDHTGEWWIPTGAGLYRFPKVVRMKELAYRRPKAIYTTRDGLASDVVFALFEDSHGDIWVGTGSPPDAGLVPVRAGLTRWARARGVFHRYSEADGLPLQESTVMHSFCEDHAGNLWIALGWTGLARYQNGRFRLFTTKDGLPSYIYRLYLDHAGQLWIGTFGGGARCVKDPAADHLRLVQYTTAEGLSNNEIYCFTEDPWGRLYIGTGRGVDRLDPTTNRIDHYDAASGFGIKGQVAIAFRDRKGTLWFGTLHGLARFEPEPPAPEPANAVLLPPVLITGLRISGVSYPVSELGQADISGLVLEPNQSQVRVDFVAPSFAPGERLLYQYRLEGVDWDWSAPTEQRTIHYGALSPGNYRFVVRAMSPSGRTSPSPAVVAFTIRPPVWRRGWFLALSGLVMVGLLYALYRYRVARLIELERVRTRIATDLHDDIGSSLSGMALLSEAVVRQVNGVHPEARNTTAEIAAIARRLVDAMNDIVWAIDPRRDDLTNLMLRVRQFASQMLEAKGIAWEFQAPEDPPAVRLDSEQRRHLLLIFKEAINNIVRHAGCTSVILAITVADHRLCAVISDNGRGFTVPPVQAPSPAGPPGNGLRNMQARAAQLGGHLAIDSAPGRGTCLTLSVPLK